MPKTKQAVEQAAQLKLYIPQLDRLEERLLEWTAQDKFQALVVKAARYGVPIFEGAYGTNTKEYGVHMDTIFPVASNTKTIIAALLFSLLEEGRLEMDDKICKFLPEYTGGGRENIAVWHFLTHTSGIVDDEMWKDTENYTKNTFGIERPGENSTDADWDQYNLKIKQAMGLPEDYDDVWEAVSLRVELKNQPRTIMSYCNHGYQKLKDVICAVTGESIDGYARRVLFDPVGMIDSHWIVPKEKWDRILGRNERCTSYEWLNSEGNYTRESGAGGLKTTANDMTNFCEMILGDGRYKGRRILSPASIREMTSNYNPTFANPWDAWALGWNYRGNKVDDAGVLRSSGSVEHGGYAGHKILVDREYGVSIICYIGEYADGSFPGFGRVNNMVIAALE